MNTDISSVVISQLNSIDKPWKIYLKNNLHEIYQKNLIPKNRLSEFKNLFYNVSNHFNQKNECFNVCLFGSQVTGLANRDSDLDISILTHDKRHLKIQSTDIDLIQILKEINDYLQSMKTIHGIEPIFDAKVPIVSFQRNDISGDISANNIDGIHKTLLIKRYLECYPKIFILGKLIKHFIKIYDIDHTSSGTMTSTAYIIMLIHFLQKKYNLEVLTIEKPSVNLFTFERNKWTEQNLPIKGSWKSKNQMPPVYVLWIDFLKYYTIEFDVEKEVINIRIKGKMCKSTKGWQNSLLAIEDPIVLTNNFGDNINLTSFNKIKDAFTKVLLNKGKLDQCPPKTIKKKRRKKNNNN